MEAFIELFPNIFCKQIDFPDLEEYTAEDTVYPFLKLATLNPSRHVVELAFAANPNAIKSTGASSTCPSTSSTTTNPPNDTILWNAACQNNCLHVIEWFMKTIYNNTNNNLLHMAFSAHASHEIISYLIQHYPQLVRHVQSENGRLPLHTACCYYASSSSSSSYNDDYCDNSNNHDNEEKMSTFTILALIQAYPDAVVTTDYWDNLPMHLACRHGASLSNLLLLYRMNPSCLGQVNDNGDTPFFCALRSSCHDDEDTMTTTISILQWFIQVNPDVIFHTDHYGETALHAVCYEGSVKTVQWVLDHCIMRTPTTRHVAVPLQDKKGNTPLHIALMHSPTPYDVSMLLLQHAPECCAMTCDGQLPLHGLFKTKELPFEFLETMLIRFPPAIEIPNTLGQYPLHLACMVKGLPLDIMELMIVTYPKALHLPDRNGNLPIGYARQCASVNGNPALLQLLSYTMDNDIDDNNVNDGDIGNENVNVGNGSSTKGEAVHKKRRIDPEPQDSSINKVESSTIGE